jgi:hypothetical protein
VVCCGFVQADARTGLGSELPTFGFAISPVPSTVIDASAQINPYSFRVSAGARGWRGGRIESELDQEGTESRGWMLRFGRPLGSGVDGQIADDRK